MKMKMCLYVYTCLYVFIRVYTCLYVFKRILISVWINVYKRLNDGGGARAEDGL